MIERLEKIFRESFENQRLKLSEEMTIDDIPGWDSIAHVNLCLALEHDFSIQLSVKEMARMTSIETIMEVISRHITK